MPSSSAAVFDPQVLSAGAAHASPATHLIKEDLAECRRLLGDGSRSFQAASRILPREVARAASALYAFCRLADDSVDAGASSVAGFTGADARGASAQDALADLHERLDRIYAAKPRPLPSDRAFAGVVARYRIPRVWPQALLEGFAWDAQGRQYEDLSQLRAYAARVAGSVGAMMARVMGVHERGALARACELGVAMQLTNIARDVGDDARLGRLYLPLEWMHDCAIDPRAWLARPRFTPALGIVVGRLLEEARLRYHGGASGISNLPIACRPGIRAAALLYADIGRAVEQRGFDSVNSRAIVCPRRKAQLVAQAAFDCLSGGLRSRAAPPPEIDFLLDATGAVSTVPRAEPQPSLHSVLDLFERLERRDRGAGRAYAMGPSAAAMQ
jgi:phytoene synthase